MSRLDELRRVAELIGIATRHVDALGVWHEPDHETLSRLIAAFGLPTDPRKATEALAEQEFSQPFGLAPVQIIGDEAPPVLPLKLPEGCPAVEWHCNLDDGGELSGRSDAAELHLPGPMPPGYHRLGIAGHGVSAELDLIVAPSSCYLPDALKAGGRGWGLAAQLYGLRSARDWGIGDFSELTRLCKAAGKLGAATVGINPLHALFAAEPQHFSPYSPSSRCWLDYLYIDVTKVSGFTEDDTARRLAGSNALAAAHRAELVDYPAVAALKRPLLEALYQRFHKRDAAATADFADFADFRRQGGIALMAFATFEALQEHFVAAGSPFSWHDWPAQFRDPDSTETAEFAQAHADRIGFFQFLQWQADRQLGEAARKGVESGLALGLYRDLAVGVNPHGADAWASQDLVVPGAAIGAPPDALARAGQNWGLAPINPLALRRQGYAPFVAALRANMRHAGILRIDHVMSLRRLYWVPAGAPATDGAYVDYPFSDLLRLVALESHRQRCGVIGEDLGTLPEGFREAMQRANVLSYRVVMFERWDDGNFIPPRDYPPLSAASAATHDLATLKGFWLGSDIAWKRRLHLYPDQAAETAETDGRRQARYQLLEALEREGLLPGERFAEFLPAADHPIFGAELGDAILAYLARSRARLTLVQLEDIAGDGEQANLPGTTDAHPNWRRRLLQPLDDLLTGPQMARIATLVTAARQEAARD